MGTNSHLLSELIFYRPQNEIKRHLMRTLDFSYKLYLFPDKGNMINSENISHILTLDVKKVLPISF